ncbi:ABC transporter permease/M1 family aminopeptidase [Roseateles sp.]|uniref:ABC transporter permease/M1 family aminopeptidase n=1 Tax=Roseateles sp. TaxID=1971397 RepID=UPI00286C7296|nr:M1 family aminopeptidase [Roseateles sp.]
MLRKIFTFEARYQLRSPLFLISFVIFFLMSFGAITSTDIQIGGPKGASNLNSPFAILQIVATMNVMTIFIVTAFVANVVIRDEEFGFAAILRSTRVGKFDYLVGRFLGAMFVAFLVTTAVPLAVLLGSLMPWLDAEQVGPLVLSHYLFAQLVMSVPTLLVLGAGFFAVATLTRSMMWSYVGAVAFIVLFGASRVLLKDPSLDLASGLADPFAIGALNRVTKYWTAADRNTLIPSLSGMLLYNRLIWLGVAAALFGLAYRLFHFEAPAKASAKAEKIGPGDAMPQQKPLASPSHGGATAWLQLRALTRFDMRFVFKSPAFFVLLAIGVLNALVGLLLTTSERGVSYLPVTRSVVDALEGSFGIIPLLIAIYYSGELVWRDRERRMHEIIDASAAPNWAHLLPKVLAITGVLLACYLTAMLTGVVFQLAHGFTQVQLASYLLWFVLPGLISALLLAILAIFVQALVPHKFVGWAVMMVLMVLGMVMGSLGFEHKLYTFAGMPEVPLSDMNEMGRFWIGRAWHQLYWLAFGAMLMVATQLLWRRGVETRLQPRFTLLRQRLAGRPGLLLGAATLAWVCSGGYIFYNSNVLNDYLTAPAQEQLQVDYEKTLWGFAGLPQPTITDVKLKVELYPNQARAEIEGSYQMENRSGKPISQVHVQWAPGLKVQRLALDGAVLERDYKDLSHSIYRLKTPLQAGDKLGLNFAVRMAQQGFVNGRPQTQIVPNGSFISNQQFGPFLGVPQGMLLQDRAKRRKAGLPPELRAAKLEDNGANAHNYLRRDSDWVTAEITLTTDADQTPIAPGTTVSDRTAQGRRTIVTRSDAPTANFFSMQSARYQKASDSWAGKDGQAVALEVYHHPAHDSNAQRMLTAMKASLDLYSEQFSPYQFKQARIIEFPAYERFAQAFAGTVPFSEAIGFIQNFKDADRDDKVDLVTFVTAHEMAHQWWGHQINGADKQGMTLLSESFAQYSALLVMEKLYGKAQIRKFLKYELDRYLSSRSGELVEELPLARVENQAYIHYRKGAVVMYALKELVGEAAVNRALQKLLAEFAFKPAPYADTRDFLRLLRSEAGPQHEALIVDLFEKITLFDLKATDAKATQRADGKFEITFTVDAKKLYADGKGRETESPLNEAMDIGAFSAEPGKKGFTRDSVLLMERRPLQSGKQQIKLLLDKAPAWVGVDPYNMRIDRNSDDNLSKVEMR